MAQTIQDLLAKDSSSLTQFKAGQSVTGTIVDSNPSRILIELPGGATGMITKRELGGFLEDTDLSVEAEIEATIIDPENEQGLILLSLRKASQDTAWAELNQICEEERIIKLKIDEANKGGLIATYKGLKAFLPVSQLMPQNYPRVEGGDAGEILKKLQALIGKEFPLRVLNVNREEGKIIVSEKSAHQEMMKETLQTIQIGDAVEGEITGVVKFGIFVSFGGVEGLVHVSELEWGHVSDPGQKYSVGEKVQVLIIGKEPGKLSFSIKQLSEDPWIEAVKAYSEGEEVSGPVKRWNDTGVFIEVAQDVQGYFSLDQFGVEKGDELTGNIREGEVLKGTILSVNAEAHRIELSRIVE